MLHQTELAKLEISLNFVRIGLQSQENVADVRADSNVDVYRYVYDVRPMVLFS